MFRVSRRTERPGQDHHRPSRVARSAAAMAGAALAGLAAMPSPLAGGIVYQSATLGPTGQSGGGTVSSTVYVGVKFELTSATTVDLIGGHFTASPGSTLFGALVQLSGSADLPDTTDLSSADVLRTTVIKPPFGSADAAANFAPLALAPGWYALVYGSGDFGATGGAAAAGNNPPVGMPQYIHRSGAQPWSSGAGGARYFLGSSITRAWSQPAGGSWNTAGNWSPGQLPEAFDDAEFDLGATYAVSFSGPAITRDLVNRRDGLTLALGGNELTIGRDVVIGTAGGAGGAGSAGSAGGASLAIHNGALKQTAVRDFIVGDTAAGALEVSGQGAIHSPLAKLIVGRSASGTLTIGGDGVVTSNGGQIAHDASVAAGVITAAAGTVQINGTWNASNALQVGRNGAGVVEINPGGMLTGGVNIFDTPGTLVRLQGGTLKGTVQTNGNPSRFEWTSGRLWIPSTNVGLSPSGQFGPAMTLAAGMTLRTTPNMSIAFSASNATQLTIAGGTLDAGVVFNDGNYAQTAGTASVQSLDNSNPLRGASSITGGTLTASRIRQSALHIGGTGRVALRDSSADSTSRVGAITIAESGKLDLRDNRLIITAGIGAGTWNGSAYTGVTGLIDAGRGSAGDALWNGATGIVTTDPRALATGNRAAIGIATAAQAGVQTFGGLSVTGSDLLVRLTWGGDANLDGVINIDDYGRIDSNIGTGATGWFNGDFNYDGKINIDDYGIIDVNIASQAGRFAAASAAGGAVVAANRTAAVPEPATLGLIGLASATLRRRRRTRLNSAR